MTEAEYVAWIETLAQVDMVSHHDAGGNYWETRIFLDKDGVIYGVEYCNGEVRKTPLPNGKRGYVKRPYKKVTEMVTRWEPKRS